MKLGTISACSLGLTAALALGSLNAGAQVTDTTARRDTTAVPGSVSGSTTARMPMRNGRVRYARLNDTTCLTIRTNSMGMADTTRHGCRNAAMRRRHRAANNAVSSTRIPVTKQSSGEVVDTTTPPPPPPPAPPETTTVAPPPPPAPAPPETTTTQPESTTTTTAAVAPPPSLHRLGSFYWGVGAGASMPQQNMKYGYGTGWNVTVPFGWDAQTIPLGLRFDAGYDRLMGRSDVGVNSDLAVWSGNADAKLRLGSLLRHFYVIGGVGASRIVGYGTSTYTTTGNSYNGTYPNGAPVATSFGNAKTEFNWNAGGGVDFGWGRSALFLESRYFHVNTNNTFGANTRFVPIILGLTFR